MVLLLRFYALRISDVATLERERVQNGQIYLHALKNGAAIWLPLYPEVKHALECLPLPRGAAQDCQYFFWNGLSDREGHIKTVVASLQSVFRKSGVVNAHAHRFRHTLATEILVRGGTIEDAANILGDSPATIRKHYAKWSVAYRERTVELFSRVHQNEFGTYLAHDTFSIVNPLYSTDKMVLEVGVEPT
jgi:integrase